MTSKVLFLAALAACVGARVVHAADSAAPKKSPTKATAKECEGYSNNAVAHNKENLELGCGYKGNAWNSEYEFHYKWCMSGGGRPVTLLGSQSRSRELAIENCRKRKGKGPAAKKGPSEKACQSTMDLYSRYMKDGQTLQAQCQSAASQNKPTASLYKQYLSACNAQDREGRLFYKNGCDKAFPSMPAPGQGPNTCARQVKDNCPLVK